MNFGGELIADVAELSKEEEEEVEVAVDGSIPSFSGITDFDSPPGLFLL